jgi:hypothetical protein
MIRWPNFTGQGRNSNGSAATPLRHYANPLDQDRAESMADEGGAAGAHIDAADDLDVAVLVPKAAAVRLGRLPARPWLVGAAVFGLAFAAGWFFLRRRA